MLLEVGERLALLSILPAEGNLLTMKIVTDLRGELGLSEEEFEVLDVRQEDGRVFWDTNKDAGKKVEIGVKGRGIVYDTLAKLDKEGKLRREHLSLCEKFEYTGE